MPATGCGVPQQRGGRGRGPRAVQPARRPRRMGSGHGLIGRAAARRGRLLAGGHKSFCLRSRHRLGLAGPGEVQPPRAELATGASGQTHPGFSGFSGRSVHARKRPGGWRGRVGVGERSSPCSEPHGPASAPFLPVGPAAAAGETLPFPSLGTGAAGM